MPFNGSFTKMSELNISIDDHDIIDSVEFGEWKQVDNFEQVKSKLVEATAAIHKADGVESE